MLPILDPTIDQWEIVGPLVLYCNSNPYHGLPNCFTSLRPPSHMMVMDMAVAEFYHTLSQLLQMSWMLQVVPLMFGKPFRKNVGPTWALLYAPCVSIIYMFVAG